LISPVPQLEASHASFIDEFRRHGETLVPDAISRLAATCYRPRDGALCC
jgi:hypothetical protein